MDEKITAITEMIRNFCQKHLNEEFEGYALKLCETLSRKRILDITRGRSEIWAAAIIYVIARLNFLFDKENRYFLTPDTICDFFDTKKSTAGNKAGMIIDVCNLGLGAEGYSTKNITDMLTFYKTPEGFIIPKSMLEKEIVVDFVEGEEAKDLERQIGEQKRKKAQEEEEKKARRAEIKRKIAEEKEKKADARQINLFGD